MSNLITTVAAVCIGVVLLATIMLFPAHPMAALSFKVGLIVGLLLYAGVVHASELYEDQKA